MGPSLSEAEVANPLPDPLLELHNASGAVIASNDNWQDTQAAQITASGLAPSDQREAAIFATLPAGNYTAVVRGANDTTGVALVEVYSLGRKASDIPPPLLPALLRSSRQAAILATLSW